jgi:uncharacterized membrane protein YeaQ/YmgE (transglycosylase-associated protein family)
MEFGMGFLVWIVIGLVGGFALNNFYRGPQTSLGMSLVFGFFGAFIGGMLGMSGYLFHSPTPLRLGGLLGATMGGLGFPLIYHFIAKRAV